jgi:virginiamycin B lyase
MLRTILTLVGASAAVAPAALVAPPVRPPAPVAITEWTVPWSDTRPRDPYPDAQGRIWFVGQAGNYIAYLEPKSGRFKRYELPEGTLPHNLIVDRRGQVWFAGNGNGTIGRLDPATGKVTSLPMPNSAARDPHTLVFDRAGDIWFTVQRGNFVGKLTTSSGAIRLVEVPTPKALPYGIVVDSKGRPWFCEFGSNRIGTIDPATVALREYPLPDAAARPRRIAVTSDDKVWFVDYVRGTLGRLDPATGKVDEHALPAGASALPYAMASDTRDRLWMVETGPQPNRLVGFDARSRDFLGETPIQPSGARVVRHMVYDGSRRALWFGTDANTIGRAALPE